MDLYLPTDAELEEFIREFERENQEIFSETFELDKLEFARILVAAIHKFFSEFPAEGYTPLSTYNDKGVEIQNVSNVTLLEDERGEPFLNVKVFRDTGEWVFNGYVNVDRFLGYFCSISLQFLSSAEKSSGSVNELLTDEKFKERLLDK